MKKTIIDVLILASLVIAMFLLLHTLKTHQLEPTDTPTEDSLESASQVVVFDMKYRGLGAPADEPLYNTSYGYSGPRDDNTSFIQALKAKDKNLQTICNSDFRGAKWSAIELDGRNPVAFYFDLNADGKVSDNEKILPQPESKWLFKHPEFITPDFIMNTRDGRQVPFRMLLRVDRSGRSVGRPSRPSCSWSPHCVLEGTSFIDGEVATLILFAEGASGSFTKFGTCLYSLQIGKKKGEITERFPAHPPLSRIINHNGIFYDLKLIGIHEKGKTVQAVLEKYSGEISEVAVEVIGTKPLKVDLDFLRVIGCEDKNLSFKISGDQFKLPAGSYDFIKGHMSYGVEHESRWTAFIEELASKVGPGKANSIKLGKPVLAITAADENKPNKDDSKNQSVFSKGTKIRFTCSIRGISGERYDRFNQNNQNNQRYERIDPKIRIVDSDGGETTLGKAEYG